jgi:hypothetical protein
LRLPWGLVAGLLGHGGSLPAKEGKFPAAV